MQVWLKKHWASGMVILVLTVSALLFYQHKIRTEDLVDETKIGVSLTPLSAPFFVADQMGLFKQYGLNVSLLPCSSGVSCADLMLSSDVDYATASESVVMFKSFQRDDILLLASFVESDNDLKLLSLVPSKISRVAQLEGKRVGVIKGSASEFYFDSVLIGSNLRDLRVEKVYLQPKELVPALLAYNVDAISAWEPMGFQVDLLSVARVHNLGIEGVYQLSFNLISRPSHLEFAGDEPTRLLQALQDAIDWIKAHPDQTMTLLSQRLEVPVEQIDWSWDDYVFRLSLGNSLLSNLQLQARWAIDSGLVSKSPPDFRRVFYSHPYQQMLAERN
ncbi:ABC transporter substrate-binding protein [Vibrio sinaloensis]|uniref:ABC transporter substrate-binding protein n=1 Tax=Photobacterium sp. (strain ATCC 43367) TaxID=379097 RepID=UPI00206D91D0|nr:ABC transporter substrate-binding protein [Vibrio sinaloensis]UPQ89712.1 ABC transporter substrate-binding protein [Vibrio sinaloensis]